MQIDVDQLLEQNAGLPAVFRGLLHLQVLALRAAQLRQIQVQHRRRLLYQLLQIVQKRV